MILNFILEIKDQLFMLHQSLIEFQDHLIHNHSKFILSISNQNNVYHQNQHIHNNFHTFQKFCGFIA